ncbi:MAG: cyclic nucleotide-binding domain-containing protein [Microscillaceae bacterium]|nr:cyclic nucleotide-binding domain-containing protein [Microscillaceae bacterium]MDW8461289.1 adenylate/guanylate cyclase domain-containing protein [Cytophagales bacterium]
MLTTSEQRLAILKKVGIFAQTNENVLQKLADATKEVYLEADQNLFKKGDEGTSMYVIVEGAVRVHEGNYDFAVLRKGQVFGEYSLLDTDNRTRSASVTAIVKTHLLMLEQDIFYDIMANQIEIVKGILKVLIKRARRQNYFEEKLAETNDQIQKQSDLIRQEKEKAERLLLNILPSEVADELKVKGKADAQFYKLATVMFADLKGFTQATEHLSPREVVSILEEHFSAFDEITTKYNVEKIKTIGDAYMCVGGAPIPNKTNPIDTVLTALEMQYFMQESIKKRRANHEKVWELSIGIHTGPLIAGVIGKKKFAYDVWGSTVNIAAQFENKGEPGHINISSDTYNLIKDYFICEACSKHIGKLEMFFVRRLKPEFSEDKEGFFPNAKLRMKLKELSKS